MLISRIHKYISYTCYTYAYNTRDTHFFQPENFLTYLFYTLVQILKQMSEQIYTTSEIENCDVAAFYSFVKKTHGINIKGGIEFSLGADSLI